MSEFGIREIHERAWLVIVVFCGFVLNVVLICGYTAHKLFRVLINFLEIAPRYFDNEERHLSQDFTFDIRFCFI